MALKFRRGTTAQQSGSLAFGEPFVNTTLGTLLVGGPNGDIVLSAGGTGSTGNFGAISGSGLDITGNAKIAGNLTLGGAITIGDATADTVNVVASLSSSLIPSVTNAFDLGSEDYFWRDIYVSTGSIKFVGAAGNVVGTLTNVGNGLNLDGGIVTNGNSTFGTSSLSITRVTGSLLVNGNVIVANGGITGSIAATNGVVSGSSQIASQISASLSAEHLNSKVAGIVSGSSQVIGILDSLNTFSGSALTRLTALEVETTNLESFTSSINTTIKSKLDADGVISGSSQVTLQSTTGFSAFDTALATITSSLISSASAAKTTNDSQDISITNLNSTTASLNTSVTNLNTFSASENSKADTLATLTGSYDTRWSTLGSLSGSFARTNSTNTFNGNQTVSGSLTITQDLFVLGSSSIQTISSSNLVIGASLVTLNTATPSSRFAGLQIIDSGSSGGSGSFLYDAVQDELLFIHRGNGTNTTSSVLLMGPETYDNLGNEIYLTNNRLPKGTGKEHLNDSQISDDGTTVSIGGALTVTGNITGPIRATNGVVSGSSQITYASISSIPSGIVSGSSQITAGSTTNFATDVKTQLNSNTVVSGSSQIIGILSSLNTYTASNDTTNTTQTSRLDQLSTASGSAITRLTTLEVETANLESFTSSINTTIKTRLNAETVVSGSSQITATSTTGFATGVKTQLDANTVVSGSSQINVASTTGDIALGTRTSGNYVATITGGTGVSSNGATSGEGITHTISIGQAVATSDNVRFNSLGIGMAATGTAGRIDAANDVVAFSSSDIRFKENIKPIENAIDKIRKISGNTYDWKEENKVEHGYEGNDVGVIAQEIEAVLPQLVQTRESGFKAVKYDKLVALLIEGIKEQQLQIEQLKIDLNNCRNNKGL